MVTLQIAGEERIGRKKAAEADVDHEPFVYKYYS